MKIALQTINDLQGQNLILSYAIGGAMALLFHDEPVATYDLDIFCLLPETGLVVSLEPLYAALRERGWYPEAEAVLIGGVPVQFIPAYNPLVIEAVEQAEEKSFDGIPVRVLRMEYLIAIMLQTGRSKDLVRLSMLTSREAAIDEPLLRTILNRYELSVLWKNLNPNA
jgi:hypothetical protein